MPHGIAVGPGDTVVVADRENSRLQFFRPDGRFLEQWTDVARLCQVAVDASGIVYVAELGYHGCHSEPTVELRASVRQPRG